MSLGHFTRISLRFPTISQEKRSLDPPYGTRFPDMISSSQGKRTKDRVVIFRQYVEESKEKRRTYLSSPRYDSNHN